MSDDIHVCADIHACRMSGWWWCGSQANDHCSRYCSNICKCKSAGCLQRQKPKHAKFFLVTIVSYTNLLNHNHRLILYILKSGQGECINCRCGNKMVNSVHHLWLHLISQSINVINTECTSPCPGLSWPGALSAHRAQQLHTGCCGGDWSLYRYGHKNSDFPLFGQPESHFFHFIFLQPNISQEQT